MAGDVARVRAKVQEHLTQSFSNITLGKDNVLSLRHGSARLFVDVRTREENDWTWVNLTVPVLVEVKPSADLNEFIAYQGADFIFGNLSLSQWSEGTVAVMLEHNLLGDYLDEAELGRAVAGMLGSADTLDDDLRTRFGGNRFHED